MVTKIIVRDSKGRIIQTVDDRNRTTKYNPKTGVRQVDVVVGKSKSGRTVISGKNLTSRQKRGLRRLEVIKKGVSNKQQKYNEVKDQILRDLEASDRRTTEKRRQKELRRQKNAAIKNAARKATVFGNQINFMKVRSDAKKQLSRGRPYSESYNQALRNQVKNYTPAPYGRFTIEGITFIAQNKKEASYLRKVKKLSEADAELSRQMKTMKDYFSNNANKHDSIIRRAAGGIVSTGVDLFYLFPSIARQISYLDSTAQGVFTSPRFRKKSFAATTGFFKSIPSILKDIGKSLDPTKPENWGNIISTFIFFKTANKAKINAAKLSSDYVPSVRNLGLVKKEISTYVKITEKAKLLAKQSIKKGFRKAYNKRLLNKLNKLSKELTASLKKIVEIEKNPKILQLEDYNLIVNSGKLLKNVGKEKTVFHSTGASVKDLFGKKFIKVLKSKKEILSNVKKSSVSIRNLASKGVVQKELLKLVNKARGVVGGAKAQNAVVKRFLTRKTVDFDILVKNHKLVAYKIKASLQKLFPKNKFIIRSMKIKGTKNFVYRLYKDGKLLADFDPLPSKISLVKLKNGSYVPSAKWLAEKKLSSISNPFKKYRYAKDFGDLKRLVGELFSDKKIFNKLKNPKGFLTVTPQPKSMGLSRIKFKETFMYFDVKVPTSYALKSLAKNVFPKWFVKGLKKLGVKKSLIKKINSLKFVRSTDRYTIISVKININGFSPKLKALANKARNGGLSARQVVSLRKQLVTYVKKNPNKFFPGTSASSAGVGESEYILSSGSMLKKLGRKFTIDPANNLFVDVVEASVSKVPKGFKARVINYLKKYSFKSLKSKLSSGDLAKVRRYRRVIKKAGRLTASDRRDLIEIFQRMLKERKAGRLKSKLKKSVRSRRKGGLRVKKVGRIPLSPAVASRVKSKSKTRSKSFSRARSRSKVVVRKSPRARVNIKRRSTSRTSLRVRPLVKPGARPRVKPRARPRVKPRARPRVKPRARLRVKPRARLRVKPRARPTFITRTKYRELIRTIPKRFRKKIKTTKDKKDLLRWLKKQPRRYVPSLAAIILRITAYKIPRNFSGLNIRPVIIKRRKIGVSRNKVRFTIKKTRRSPSKGVKFSSYTPKKKTTKKKIKRGKKL